MDSTKVIYVIDFLCCTQEYFTTMTASIMVGKKTCDHYHLHLPHGCGKGMKQQNYHRYLPLINQKKQNYIYTVFLILNNYVENIQATYIYAAKWFLTKFYIFQKIM